MRKRRYKEMPFPQSDSRKIALCRIGIENYTYGCLIIISTQYIFMISGVGDIHYDAASLKG